MPPPRRTRILPCEKCREKHIKCDGEDPCANCKNASIRCARVSKRFRFKRLVRPSGAFAFKPDQTWIATEGLSTPDGRVGSLPIIDESTYRAANHPPPSTAQPTSKTALRDHLAEAASLLHSLSRGGITSTIQRRAAVPEPRSSSFSPLGIWPDDAPSNDSIRDDHVSIGETASLPHADTRSADRTHISSLSHPIPSTYSVGEQSTNSRLLSPNTVSHGRYSFDGLDLEKRSDHGNEQSSPGSEACCIPETRTTEGNTSSLSLQEACLVRCFSENVASAFDTTDRDHHYLNVVPWRALQSPLLLNAVCTAAARFLIQFCAQQDPPHPVEFDGIHLPGVTEESVINYHNTCISHLIKVSTNPVHSSSGDALTAITILRYHEQVDVHFTRLDNEVYSHALQNIFRAQQDESLGLLSLVPYPTRGPGIHGPRCSSLRSSACLIALRQEIWAVLLYQRPFRLPLFAVKEYADFADMEFADAYDWTNRILSWCAHVVNFCYRDEVDSAIQDNRSRAEQWAALAAFQRDWDRRTPAPFRPLFYEKRDPANGRYFPQIWLANECQVVGMQHVELGRIVLAAHDSKHQRLGIGAGASNRALENTLRESTRIICGLAMSNWKSQPAVVTGAVAISICGTYFYDTGDRKAMLRLLNGLSRDYAWPTVQLVNTLRQQWDDASLYDSAER